ncbi:N-acetylmuramoyl-L-alanine amidase [Persicobacter psychrovividus]|uniref:N-acetylmuramoyl-L-alanine amidase n=1 Tax=Persicobacter psychrovividus TaxID=387638 RepID=A0ABN6L3Y8_9BACT|nr:N-acetylmuramoyl-L-alanine amidase [Persicobacter psychrovividus]
MSLKHSRFFTCLFFLLLFTLPQIAFSQNSHEFVKAKVLKGEGVFALLRRYQLVDFSQNIDYFYGLNQLGPNKHLQEGVAYSLPMYLVKYNGKSIRSTLGIDSWAIAQDIADYNDAMVKGKLKAKDFRKDLNLWVPYHMTQDPVLASAKSQLEEQETIFPIFGDDYAKIEMKDEALKGCVYYIVSGHGGPDPGAIGKYGKYKLYEDEYAYDVSLRLARNLIARGAKAYVIIRDKEDGIRDEAILEPSHREVCWEDQEIPLNQLDRLKQRADVVNSLYKYNKAKGYKYQRAVMIHIDSRKKSKRIDMFFYYQDHNEESKLFASSLYKTIKAKYKKKRSGRGYEGSLGTRDLYMLRNLEVPSAFLELGNISNPFDQRRIVEPDNRQAVANWLTSGMLKKE